MASPRPQGVSVEKGSEKLSPRGLQHLKTEMMRESGSARVYHKNNGEREVGGHQEEGDWAVTRRGSWQYHLMSWNLELEVWGLRKDRGKCQRWACKWGCWIGEKWVGDLKKFLSRSRLLCNRREVSQRREKTESLVGIINWTPSNVKKQEGKRKSLLTVSPLNCASLFPWTLGLDLWIVASTGFKLEKDV